MSDRKRGWPRGRWPDLCAVLVLVLVPPLRLAAAPDGVRPDAGQASDAGVPLGEGPARVFALPDPGGAEVVVVPIEGTIEFGLTALVDRALREHPDAAVILLDINTFGGRVDAAVKIRDALLGSEVPTVAYVHPRAISAGALITLACERVAFAPAASMGAATPFSGGDGSGDVQVDEKVVSYMRAEMRTTAEHRGRRGDVAEAMVDRDVVIEGVIEKGKTLTLDTDDALRLGIGDMRAATLEEVVAALGIRDAHIVRVEQNWAEEVARFLTDPAVTGLLMSLGMLALFASIYTGSFGVLTLLGLLSLGLFFGGHAVANLVGWEEALLLVGGLVLVGIEVVALPGFGLVGLLGGLAIVASLVLALIAHPLSVAIEVGDLSRAITRVGLSFLGTVLGAVLLVRILPRTAIGRGLVLTARLDDTEPDPVPAGGHGAGPVPPAIAGAQGITEGDLRPAGKVRIAGVLHDARSERAFIEPGQPVQVLRVVAGELIVRHLPTLPAAPAGGDGDVPEPAADAPGEPGP